MIVGGLGPAAVLACVGLGGCDGSGAVAPPEASVPAAEPATPAEPAKVEDPPTQPKPTEPKAKAEAAEPPSLPLGARLSPLPLQAGAADSTTVRALTTDDAVLALGPGVFVAVMPTAERHPEAVEEAKKNMLPNAEAVETRSLEDGWLLRYRARNDWGPVVVVQARRTIGGATYWCESVAITLAQQEAAAEFCSDLRAATP